MPKGSPELTNSRRDEIINACANLYETMNFKDITIKEIGSATSFTRTSIYNYFHTKEEIFLALLQREYELWIKDIEKLRDENKALTASQFADGIADTLSRRDRLLKILSMNLYDLEEYCRSANLTDFKTTYKRTLDSISSCLKKFFVKMSDQDIQDFLYAFFPFIFGIYPYTKVTEKQANAMKNAGIKYPQLSVYDITRPVVLKLLQGFD